VDVIDDRHFVKGSRYLIGSGHTQFDSLVSGVVTDLLTSKVDFPRVLLIGSHQQVKNGCLTGAVWAHQAQNLSFFLVKRDVVYGNNAAESLGKITYFQ
jgi:hypothetical protein